MRVHMSGPKGEEKFQMDMDHENDDGNRLIKSSFLGKRPFRWTSLILPFLLGLLILIGTSLLILTITRWNLCRREQLEQAEAILSIIPDEHMKPWTPCVKTTKESCACPASFVRSKFNPSHCLPEHTRCLKTCKHNPHCKCYGLTDAELCRNVTRNWIDHELKISRVERFRQPKINQIIQFTWMEQFSRQMERLLVDMRSGERLFLSTDRRTGIAVHNHDDDYLLNERWSKVEINGTHQHIVYTQLNAQTHTCRMSALRDDGSVTHGPIHSCPGSPIGAPYYLGVACSEVLVLWHGTRQIKVRRQEGWTLTRHHFEAIVPHLPVLLDPFHRYYSIYDDSMIEIKDINGDLIGQILTEIIKPTRFEFLDQFGTLFVANSTHMQTLQSKNQHAWLDY